MSKKYRNKRSLDRKRRYRKGDIYYADLSGSFGSEQGGYRPVVIIQNNTANYFSPTVIVASISSRIGIKAKLPTHYYIDAEDGLTLPSIVLAEQIRTLDKCRLGEYIGHLKQSHIDGIDRAIVRSEGLHMRQIVSLCQSCAKNVNRIGVFAVNRIAGQNTEKHTICICCNQRIGEYYAITVKYRESE